MRIREGWRRDEEGVGGGGVEGGEERGGVEGRGGGMVKWCALCSLPHSLPLTDRGPVLPEPPNPPKRADASSFFRCSSGVGW